MSSTGTIIDTTPLLPCRPAILSPGWILRFTATKTLTIFMTPGGSSSPRCSLSTLSTKRRSRLFLASSYCLPMASTSAMAASSASPISHHWLRGSSPSTSSEMMVPLRAFFGPLAASLPMQRRLQARIDVAVEDLQLVVAVLGEALDLLALDRHGALVLLDAVAIEDAHLHDRAVDARRQPQRRVAHVGGLLAEDGAQQLLLRRHRALALGRDLADQDVARVHLGADEDDAGLVEVPAAPPPRRWGCRG